MFDGPCDSSFWGFLGDVGGWGWIGMILNLVIWVALIVGFTLLVVWAVRRARVPYTTMQPTAVDILRTRYAQGEITQEQYKLMKQDIG